MHIYSPTHRSTPHQFEKSTKIREQEQNVSFIKLANNENPLGASPKALLAAQNALQKINNYPDDGYSDLKKSLAKFLSIKSNQLTIGNGSENILELIVKAYLDKNNAAVVSQYTFLTIPMLINHQNARLIVVPTTQWEYDVPAIINAIDSETRILFIVNPSNPMGTYINDNYFRLLMKSIPADVLVVIDEAYGEYSNVSDFPNTLDYLETYQNLIITRTFSKAYGLAALRLGYAISNPSIASKLNAVKLPYNVNLIAAKAGAAALDDQEHIRKSREFNLQGLRQLKLGLEALKLSYISSITNFITIEVSDGISIYQKLLQKGIIVRPLTAYGMPNHIRVSIGTKNEIEQFLEAIRQLISKG